MPYTLKDFQHVIQAEFLWRNIHHQVMCNTKSFTKYFSVGYITILMYIYCNTRIRALSQGHHIWASEKHLNLRSRSEAQLQESHLTQVERLLLSHRSQTGPFHQLSLSKYKWHGQTYSDRHTAHRQCNNPHKAATIYFFIHWDEVLHSKTMLLVFVLITHTWFSKFTTLAM